MAGGVSVSVVVVMVFLTIFPSLSYSSTVTVLVTVFGAVGIQLRPHWSYHEGTEAVCGPSPNAACSVIVDATGFEPATNSA